MNSVYTVGSEVVTTPLPDRVDKDHHLRICLKDSTRTGTEWRENRMMKELVPRGCRGSYDTRYTIGRLCKGKVNCNGLYSTVINITS